jgi:glycosyltransferase involved in cell wall biosynthesis
VDLSGKIVHAVYECTPGRFRGGVQKMVYELATAQAAAGADVEIWAPERQLQADEHRSAAVPVRYFAEKNLLGARWSPQLITALKECVQEIAVLHAHNTFEPLNLQVGHFARRHRIPVYFHPHGALDPKLFAGLSLKAAKKKIYNAICEVPNLNQSAGVFALTPLEVEQLRQLGVRAPVHQIPNGIALPPRAPARQLSRKQHGFAHDECVLLYVGRIHPKKRIEDILDAVAALRPTLPRLKLLIGGSRDDPSYAYTLDRRIEQLALQQNVQWLGFLDEREKPSFWAAADAFVHASESEGMAMSILEALSYGMPTVVTIGCYMSSAARAGAVIECGQGGAELAAAIREVVSNETLRGELRIAAMNYVKLEHDWAVIARDILQIYARSGARANCTSAKVHERGDLPRSVEWLV